MIDKKYLREVLDELPNRRKNKKSNEKIFICFSTKYDNFSILIDDFFDYPEEQSIQFRYGLKYISVDYEDIESIGYNSLFMDFE